MKNDRENKWGSAWKIALLPLILGLLANFENAGVLLAVLVPVLLAFGVGWLISKEVRRGKGESERPTAQGIRIREKLEQLGARPHAAAGEVKSEQRTAYTSGNFDLEEYDRRKRIEQLDVFLKNGIIDRAEYRRMKERYEKS